MTTVLWRIYVKDSLPGPGFSFDIEPETTIGELSRMVRQKLGRPPAAQVMIIFQGRLLQEDLQIQQTGVTNESTVHARVRS